MFCGVIVPTAKPFDFLMQERVNQLFTVPNTPEGHYFLFLADKYLNHECYSLRRRGRTPNNKAMKKDGTKSRKSRA